MTPTTETALDWALFYYDLGLMPVPVHRVIAIREGRPVCSCANRERCPSPGKHPTLQWSQYQSRRPSRDEVAGWWSGDNANRGVGILTGAVSGNIFVLDVDIGPGKDGDDSLRALQLQHDDLPETAEVRTGSGGRHLYFRAPPGVAVVRNSAGKLGPGLDIRGEGGFVVAPPSVHASGQPYVWSWQNTLEHGIADAPAWLLDLVRADAPMAGATPRERAPVEPLQRPAGAGSTGGLEPPVDDGREQYMRDTVHAVAIELTGENGAWPTGDEIFDIAWPQFRRRVDLSRPGRITADNAEAEMRGKCISWARKAEIGGFGALEEVVAGYQGRKRPDPRQGPGNRQEEPSRNTGQFEGAASGGEASEPPPRVSRFPLLYANEVEAAEPAIDFVEGLLVEGGMSVIYGDSNVGKTFAALDLAMHIATGRRYRGREVERGGVIYVALEGVAGIRNRVAAWMKHYGIDPQTRCDLPLVVIPSAVNLLDPDADVDDLVESIAIAAEQIGIPVKWIVIDTLSRALAGGNENSPDDMGALVISADRLRHGAKSAIGFVHHSGKDQARGARGHSLLRAATDTEIEISRQPESEVAVIKVTKQRELEIDGEMGFRLAVVNLGTNRRGKPLTSCVAVEAAAEEVEAAGAKRAQPRGKYQPGMLRVLRNLLAGEGAQAVIPKTGMPTVRAIKVSAWLEECFRDGTLERGNSRMRHAWADGRNALRDAGLACFNEEWAWLP